MLLETETLSQMLILDEGKRDKPYEDSEGILTIGVGRNLEHNGLYEDEITYLLNNDISIVEKEVSQFDWFIGLDSVRRLVIADMAFNLGLSRLLGFKKMIGALVYHDYDTAADEMLDSKWARQVTKRADRLAYMMRTGEMHEAYLG